MMALLKSCVLFTLLFAVFVQSGFALRCYVCNSHYNTDCEDLLNDEYLNDCDVKYPQQKGNFTMCRKMHQTIDDDKRVFRDCAIEGEDKCVTRTGTKEIKVQYCECNGNGCNSANGMFNLAISFTVVLCAAFSFLSFSR